MKNLVLVNEELNKWCGTEGVNYYEGDTALGFLFKYAVPKVMQHLLDIVATSEMEALGYLFTRWLRKIADGFVIEDALFWAIWKIRC